MEPGGGGDNNDSERQRGHLCEPRRDPNRTRGPAEHSLWDQLGHEGVLGNAHGSKTDATQGRDRNDPPRIGDENLDERRHRQEGGGHEHDAAIAKAADQRGGGQLREHGDNHKRGRSHSCHHLGSTGIEDSQRCDRQHDRKSCEGKRNGGQQPAEAGNGQQGLPARGGGL